MRGNRAGFTLLEMILAIALFVVVVTIAVGLFFTALQSQRQVTTRQTAIAASRYSLETIAQQVRNSAIAYDKYAGGALSNPMNELWLYQADRDRYYQYYVDSTSLLVTIAEGFNDSTFALLRPEDVLVNEVSFIIQPLANPFDQATCSSNLDCPTRLGVVGVCTIDVVQPVQTQIGLCTCNSDTDCRAGYQCVTEQSGLRFCLPPDRQPLVTIRMNISPVDQSSQEIILQTTVSSRVYQR